MRRALTFSITLAIAVISHLNAGPGVPPPSQDHALNLSPNNGAAAPTAPNSSATPEESDNDTGDDTLYRAPTKESLGSGMTRDEGALHFKPRRKEKINEVDSLKNLQSSGTDPKFQGSLAISGVPSVTNISSKAKQDSEVSNGAAEQEADSGDSRFAKKRLTFVPQKKDEQNKTRSEDSTPSPTPTASVTAKDSGASKK